MNEKEIITQLNKLKEIKPNNEWSKSNRDLLLSQIEASSGTDKTKGWVYQIKLPFTLVRQMSQPVMAAFLIFGFLFAGSVASLRAARDTVPGDSLYIAKVVSEKTQQALTFDEKKKIKLGIGFASNRADEINRVMATDEHEEQKEKRVEQLVSKFKKELSAAKTRINRIQEDSKPAMDQTPESTLAVTETEETEEEAMVFSANLNKEEEGISISDPEATKETEEENEEETLPELNVEEPVIATSAEENEESATSSVEEVIEEEGDSSEAQSILGEAEEFLNQDNFEATIDKLEEADEAIGVTIDSGQVQGLSEQASSTPEDSGEVLGVEEEETASTTE